MDKKSRIASAKSRAEVQKKVYEVFGCDGVGQNHGLHGIGILYGAKISVPDHQPISIIENPLNSINELSKLDLGKATLEHDGNARDCFMAAQILREDIGHEVGCGMGFAGVFTAASGLLGTANLLKALRKDPEGVHRLMEFVTQALLQLTEPFIKDGFSISVADPVASNTVISKQNFRDFVMPYHKKYIESCLAFGSKSCSIHICGDTLNILDDIVECGYKDISIDNIVDMEAAKNKIGHKAHLSGNVSPTGALFLGTPAEVKEDVKACFRKGWDSPMGFTLATGCDSVYGTPLENSLAFMEEGRKCAAYPYKIENFL